MGLMGASSTPAMVLLFLSALEHALEAAGHRCPPGAGAAAAAADAFLQGSTELPAPVRPRTAALRA